MLKKISELTATTELDDDSLFVVVHNGETKKITKANVETAIVGDLEDVLEELDIGSGVE